MIHTGRSRLRAAFGGVLLVGFLAQGPAAKIRTLALLNEVAQLAAHVLQRFGVADEGFAVQWQGARSGWGLLGLLDSLLRDR